MADFGAFPVTPDVPYKVKLGKSFSDRSNNAFHTISYDFKPKSVDDSKPAKMRVSGDEVIVSVPNMQAESSEDVTQFRGGKKMCQKDCVLIINTKTKEATLERVSNMVQLKVLRTRKEKTKLASGKPLDRSISPLPNPPSTTASHSLKMPKLTMGGGVGRSVSPMPGRKPPKKKRKTIDNSLAAAVTAREEPTVRDTVEIISSSNNATGGVGGGSRKNFTPKAKPELPPKVHTAAAFSSLSSSLSSSSDSELEEVTRGLAMPPRHLDNLVPKPLSVDVDGNGVEMVGVNDEGAVTSSSEESSDSSSGSESGDSSEHSLQDDFTTMVPEAAPQRSMTLLHNDLQLSDPSSESDSD